MKFLLVLAYAVAVIFIVYHFSAMWALTIALLLALLVPALQKIVIDNDLADDRAKRKEAVNAIGAKIDAFGERIGAVRADIGKSVISSQEARAYAAELKADSVRLARRIAELESTLVSMRRTFTTAFGSFDDRLQLIEKKSQERRENL